MKLKNVNEWLTLTANLGVVAGLVFLALQVRQNTQQLRIQASYSINEGLDMMNSGIYNHQDLAEIVLQGEKDYHSLEPVEGLRFEAFQWSRINLAEHILDLEKNGVPDVHIEYVKFLEDEFGSSSGLQTWFSSVLEQDRWAGSDALKERLTP